MKKILFLFLLIASCARPTIRPKNPNRVPEKKERAEVCTAKPIVIAVIDTGFGYEGKGKGATLCKFGHKDFTGSGTIAEGYDTVDPVPLDTHAHGTHIAGIIDGYASQTGTNYCMVIIKYYDPKSRNNSNLEATVNAITYATQIKADIINYSGGGIEFSNEEKKAVEKFLDKGGRFIAAAGNERTNLDEGLTGYYPAFYDKRIVSVGNAALADPDIIGPVNYLDKSSKQYQPIKVDGSDQLSIPGFHSNYGNKVSRWEYGEEVIVYNFRMTGTSQATAIATGKIVSKIKRNCKNSVDSLNK